MKRKLKRELTEYFEAPKPERKQGFVRQYGMPKISLVHMVSMQARYISKWVWLLSVLFCGLAFYVAGTAEQNYVNFIFAFVPFLVMLSVTESTRSYRCGMEELELAVRFSLKSIVMARMVMLGVGNLMTLGCVAFLLGNHMQLNVVYLIAPYFITAGGGLCIVRKFRGNEGTYLCFVLAAAVSALTLYLPWQFTDIFTTRFANVWVIASILGICVTVRESYRTIRMTEDLVWN